PRASDERNPLDVFVCPGPFPDEHQFGVRIPDAEDDLCPSKPMQLAPCAVADILADRLECPDLRFGWRFCTLSGGFRTLFDRVRTLSGSAPTTLARTPPAIPVDTGHPE